MKVLKKNKYKFERVSILEESYMYFICILFYFCVNLKHILVDDTYFLMYKFIFVRNSSVLASKAYFDFILLSNFTCNSSKQWKLEYVQELKQKDDQFS